MKTYILLMTFVLASGEPVDTETQALHADKQRPIRSMEACLRAAEEQRQRFLVAFERGNGMFTDVHITCKEATQ